MVDARLVTNQDRSVHLFLAIEKVLALQDPHSALSGASHDCKDPGQMTLEEH